jgi:predicted phosphodiesterase
MDNKLIRSICIWAIYLLGGFACTSAPEEIRFGVVADCQYCDCPAAGSRIYRQSPAKLQAAIDTFNMHELDFVVHLGDFIDREIESFDTLTGIMARSQAPVYHVLGNHDYSVADEQKERIPGILHMPARYYAFECGAWKFLVVDGNDLSFQGYPAAAVPEEAQEMLARLQQEDRVNAYNWNGGIGAKQMAWMEEELDKAQEQDQPVILFCHFPIYPVNAHNLWNDDAVVQLIAEYDCVKAWMNGHNHAGLYGMKDSLHFVTFPGMVETMDTNAFGIVSLQNNKIAIDGYGRLEDLVYDLK